MPANVCDIEKSVRLCVCTYVHTHRKGERLDFERDREKEEWGK